ncbi:MAG: hypothetical protein Q4A31_01755 [Corynebacterium sp.]|uniref:hypothetical protein n=1 Tax=Corynebacterium sp. TaxID=1720 RepID=UPI0026DDA905|nr:hypothetical protein [Corynebacterium sp.]MDO4760631.1 hypothetical protein [Corynebacterium sp.]
MRRIWALIVASALALGVVSVPSGASETTTGRKLERLSIEIQIEGNPPLPAGYLFEIPVTCTTTSVYNQPGLEPWIADAVYKVRVPAGLTRTNYAFIGGTECSTTGVVEPLPAVLAGDWTVNQTITPALFSAALDQMVEPLRVRVAYTKKIPIIPPPEPSLIPTIAPTPTPTLIPAPTTSSAEFFPGSSDGSHPFVQWRTVIMAILRIIGLEPLVRFIGRWVRESVAR